MEKYKIQVHEAIPLVHEMIKMVALGAEIGKSSSWIHNKQNGNVSNGKKNEFIQSDIDLINRGLQSMGKRLMETHIVYSEDREAVIGQVKEVSSAVNMPYIYLKRMGKNRTWYSNRVKKETPPAAKTSFSENDILSINMNIREIAIRLLSIEITL